MSSEEKRVRVPDAEELPGDAGAVWGSWARPDEVDTFDEFVRRFWNKEITEDEFRAFRLQNGVYGQRQQGLQMVRVKIPAGGLNAEQLDCLAGLARSTPRGAGHVTTRQNLQFHFVKLEDSTEWLDKINAAGMTTREACSNTLRTMTACHRAGVCATEAFDVSPYAAAATAFFLRNPMNQSLPRKAKFSFSGCVSDCALPLIHDLGAVAMLQKDAEGVERRGFQLWLGGGLGAQPKAAQLLEAFTPEDKLIPTMAAVVRVFDRHGNREQKALARMKYLVAKIGIEKMRELVFAERAKLLAAFAGQWPDLKVWVEGAGTAGGPPSLAALPGGDAEYERWLATNTQAQKQPGYALVHVRLELGDITADQLAALGAVVRAHSNGTIRTTIQQNFAIRWVRVDGLPEVYAALRTAGLAKPGAERLADVTSCPGADTCQLGITSSRGMARAVGAQIEANPALADLPGVRVKVSGCPNSCGQHHIASIGLFGGARTVDGRAAPTYQMMLGGGLGGADGTPFGFAFLKFPAANAPEAVRRIVELYQRGKAPGEAFSAFVDRYGRDRLKAELAPLAELPSYDADPSKYRDLGTPQEDAAGGGAAFSVKTGKGECAQ